MSLFYIYICIRDELVVEFQVSGKDSALLILSLDWNSLKNDQEHHTTHAPAHTTHAPAHTPLSLSYTHTLTYKLDNI